MTLGSILVIFVIYWSGVKFCYREQILLNISNNIDDSKIIKIYLISMFSWFSVIIIKLHTFFSRIPNKNEDFEDH